jgi:hypothetical protein
MQKTRHICLKDDLDESKTAEHRICSSPFQGLLRKAKQATAAILCGSIIFLQAGCNTQKMHTDANVHEIIHSDKNIYKIGKMPMGLSYISRKGYRTCEVVGAAMIRSMDTNLFSTLQLNVYLHLHEKNGKLTSYWTQNIVNLDEIGEDYYEYSLYAKKNDNVEGNGTWSKGLLTRYDPDNYYAYNGNLNDYYHKDKFYVIETRIRAIRGRGVKIDFSGYDIMNPDRICVSFGHDDSKTRFIHSWNNIVFIKDKNLENAYLVSNTKQYADNVDLSGIRYQIPYPKEDIEFVIAGDGDGSNVIFKKLDADFALFGKHNGKLTTFPTYYPYGRDTGEKANNVEVRFETGSSSAHLTASKGGDEGEDGYVERTTFDSFMKGEMKKLFYSRKQKKDR